MTTHCTPLAVCEALLAPISELGKLAGKNEKAAWAWRRGSLHRDAGDLSPRVMRRFLAHALKNEIPLTADHLVWGAPLGEVTRLCERIGKPVPAHLRPDPQPKVAAE